MPEPVTQAAPKPTTKPGQPKPPNGAAGPEEPIKAADSTETDGQPPESGETKAADTTEPELYALTINGEERQVTREQLLRMAQKAEASEERFRKAAETSKRLDGLLSALSEDPVGVMLKLGVDLDRSLAPYLKQRADEAALDDNEREKLALARERDQYKRKAEEADQAKKLEAQRQLDERNAQRLEATLLKAAEAKGLSGDPETLELLTTVALEAIELGYEMTPEQVCDEVLWRQSQREETFGKQRLGKLDGETLLKFLGDDVIKRIQAATLKRQPAPEQTKKPKGEPKTKPPTRGYVTPREFEKKFGL